MSGMQRTDEWRKAKLGKVGASKIADVCARTKSGWGASRGNYMAELLLERLTGKFTEGYVNQAMQFGMDTEDEARLAYVFSEDHDVEEVGFVVHPKITMAGCSPDGLVGKDGLVEIKVPNPATHLETVLGGSVDDKYIKQMQFQMAVTGRKWCDYASYHPAFPEAMRLYVQRVARDEAMIATIEKDVREFLVELAAKESRLKAKYGPLPNPLAAG